MLFSIDISSGKKLHFEGKTLVVRNELKFSFFQVSSHFSMIFCKISKFHDISMTGKAFIIFPGAAGTLWKKDGKLQFCIDLCRLNIMTVKDDIKPT